MKAPEADGVKFAANALGLMRSGKGFYGLLSANLVSMAGSSMSMLAIPWFVLATTGRPMEAGLVAFAEMLPYVLVQAFGAPLVDRLGRRETSIGSDLAAALAMGAVPLAYGWGILGLPLLASLMALVGSSRGAGDIARRVLVPRLAGAASLPLERASGLYDGVNRLAGLLGGPLAGILIAAISAPAVLVVDAASFAASALLVSFTVDRSSREELGAAEERESGAKPGYLADLIEGFSHLLGDRLLLGIGALLIVTNLLDQAYFSVMLPLWITRELASPLALGVFSGLFGLGAVAGNGLMGALAPRLPRRIPFALSFLICGAPRFLVPAFSSTFAPLAAMAFLAGLGAGGINPALGAVEFERVPRHLQARVLGALGAMAWAGIPLGGLVGGVATEVFGLRTALASAGIAYLLATLGPFVFPVWREMERGRITAHQGTKLVGD